MAQSAVDGKMNTKIGVFTYAAWLIFPDGEVKTTVLILSCSTGAITQPLTPRFKNILYLSRYFINLYD